LETGGLAVSVDEACSAAAEREIAAAARLVAKVGAGFSGEAAVEEDGLAGAALNFAGGVEAGVAEGEADLEGGAEAGFDRAGR
jgi:hypothetical protein